MRSDRTTRSILYVAALLCSIAIYELPYLLTLANTGWCSLPPVLSADQMLYLNVSSIHHVSPTEVINPWYGDLVSTVDVPHLRFSVIFLLFRFTHMIFRSWTLALLVWVAVWAGCTFIAAAFCLDALFPDGASWLSITGGLGLLVLQSPLIYAADIRNSLPGLFQLQLPFIRFAIPQAIVPLALLYLGLQVKALGKGSTRTLIAMALLQFGVFAAFPYILPVVALGTGIAIMISKYRNQGIALSWKAIFVFAAACGVLDIGYFVLTGFGKSHGNVQFGLQFRPELILPSMRAHVLLLLIVAALALFSRASMAAKATVAGLAVSNALFGFSDVFFPPAMQMLDHPNYIIGLTTWLPLLLFLGTSLGKFDRPPLRVTLFVALLLTGAWEGFANFRTALPVNQLQAAAVQEVETLALTSKDFVIAPAEFADDISSWIPLVSPARVLYTPDGENILSATDTRQEQSLRQAAYFTLGGMTAASLTTIGDNGPFRFNVLVQQGERGYQRSTLVADRLYAQSIVRERLEPDLALLRSDRVAASRILSGYDRIVVIDNATEPFFDPSALSQWLETNSIYERKGLRVRLCRFK